MALLTDIGMDYPPHQSVLMQDGTECLGSEVSTQKPSGVINTGSTFDYDHNVVYICGGLESFGPVSSTGMSIDLLLGHSKLSTWKYQFSLDH